MVNHFINVVLGDMTIFPLLWVPLKPQISASMTRWATVLSETCWKLPEAVLILPHIQGTVTPFLRVLGRNF